MKKYSSFSKSSWNNMKLVTSHRHKEGIFKMPNGKFIARVKKDKYTTTTLSQHSTEQEALEAYNKFYENKKP